MVNPMHTIRVPELTVTPLRAARLARGLTLRAAARRAGIDPGYLSKVERGRKQLSVESLHRLAVALEMSELAGLLEPFLCDRHAA